MHVGPFEEKGGEKKSISGGLIEISKIFDDGSGKVRRNRRRVYRDTRRRIESG